MKVSVAAINIVNERFFIAKRNPGGAMGGKWEFPGGKCEEGETPEQALEREIKEELDVDIVVGAKLAESSFENNGVEHKLLAYRTSFLSDKFTLREHTECRWEAPEGIRNLDFTPSDRAVLDLLTAGKNE
ncbi:MAG: (deoxy)nucleoside triphosphate pyrophosphohydrolase [Spirochaetaceae bacterium]|nr:(deoxy)nucleoside triphosphate pyrophosphohydrolase [Spirochaetaceae bacterium]